MKAPICVFGANPIGLSAALLLAKQKIPVRVFDSLEERSHQNESSVLFPSSLELFDKIGLTDSFLEKGQKVDYFKFLKKSQTQVDLDFSTLKTPYPFICALSHYEIEEVLIQELFKYDIPIERGVSLVQIEDQKDHLNLSLKQSQGEKENATFSYLLGCEGVLSQVCKCSGIKKQFFGWAHHYLMADVLLNWNERPHTVASFQHPKGYVLILPIKANHYRIVCDLKNDFTQVQSKQSQFKEVLMQRVPRHLDLEDIEWLSELSFSYFQVETYRKNRVFLLGDSAHSFSPIGGQSLNSGLQDVFNLSWKLKHVYEKEARSVLLASYSRERKPAIKRILKNTRRLLELASSSKLLERKLRDMGMFLFNKVETLKEKAARDLAGLGLRYRKSPILMNKGFLRLKRGLHVGERPLDAWLIHSQSKDQVRFFELLSSLDHHLIFYIQKKDHSKVQEILSLLNLKYEGWLKVHKVSSNKSWKEKDLWCDESQKLRKHYHLGSSFMIFIRPDHVIGALSSLIDFEVIQTYFEQFLTLNSKN